MIPCLQVWEELHSAEHRACSGKYGLSCCHYCLLAHLLSLMHTSHGLLGWDPGNRRGQLNGKQKEHHRFVFELL